MKCPHDLHVSYSHYILTSSILTIPLRYDILDVKNNDVKNNDVKAVRHHP